MSIKIVKHTSTHNTNSRYGKIEYIVIHYTAGRSSAPGTALQTAIFFATSAQASADFIVDDATVVQYNPDLTRYSTWQCGDLKSSTKGGKYYGICGNSNSVGIEICSTNPNYTTYDPANSSNWSYTSAVVDRAVELTKYLMKTYNVPASKVIRHYDVSGKLCPGIIGWNEDSGDVSKWKAFKRRIGDNSYTPGVVVVDEDSDISEEYDSESLVQYVDYTKLHPYMLTLDTNSSAVDYKSMKEFGVVGVCIEAGHLYDSSHKAVDFRNSKLQEQVEAASKAEIPWAFYFTARAQSVREAEEEMYAFSFTIRKYPPRLGVWLALELTKSKSINDAVVDKYYKELIRLGMIGRVGFYVTEKQLKQISWDRHQEGWYLWINRHVEDVSEFQTLMTPEFFDMDEYKESKTTLDVQSAEEVAAAKSAARERARSASSTLVLGPSIAHVNAVPVDGGIKCPNKSPWTNTQEWREFSISAKFMGADKAPASIAEAKDSKYNGLMGAAFWCCHEFGMGAASMVIAKLLRVYAMYGGLNVAGGVHGPVKFEKLLDIRTFEGSGVTGLEMCGYNGELSDPSWAKFKHWAQSGNRGSPDCPNDSQLLTYVQYVYNNIRYGNLYGTKGIFRKWSDQRLINAMAGMPTNNYIGSGVAGSNWQWTYSFSDPKFYLNELSGLTASNGLMFVAASTVETRSKPVLNHVR